MEEVSVKNKQVVKKKTTVRKNKGGMNKTDASVKNVEPVEFIIPAKDVIKRYNFNSFEFVRCRNGILFHVFGGLHTFVSMRMMVTYEHLSAMLDLYDEYEKADENQKLMTDAVINMTTLCLEAIMMGALSDEALSSIGDAVFKQVLSIQDKSEKAELQEETPEENAAFENLQNALNLTLKENGKD